MLSMFLIGSLLLSGGEYKFYTPSLRGEEDFVRCALFVVGRGRFCEITRFNGLCGSPRGFTGNDFFLEEVSIIIEASSLGLAL